MKHLILGYGYCGYYLARHLLNQQQSVTAISRHLDSAYALEGLAHISHDIATPFIWEDADTIIYYLIPPAGDNDHDLGLQKFLTHSHLQASQVIYFGSSGVYGDHQGAWVDELSVCHITSKRQQRRLDAENQWVTFCQKHHIPLTLLRIAGIYGPHRLPLQAAREQIPIINPQVSPYTNHIYVENLAEISVALTQIKSSGIYNIADGNPTTFGVLQQLVAQLLELAPPSLETFEQAWERASPMKKEFLSASKRLSIQSLKTKLQSSLHLTPLADAVKLSLKSQGLLS
ncbi:SDR family oxidoreductase [Legionella hackeliae]|uniref:NAD-dependent epimerase/dehydratase n=1 Tax=Legionella hackeliae TaxID=449 RepID=A0A0A8US99_LEGHA|nr:SDR family oxidoreductase [Legionella hackeliae]KTD10468.1 NAD-dependent epimerase/dehydratase [Legionella hackeliae]CEK09972.1 conserved protein of unknown function [Legionella hackeliae]STX49884.1 oxidoreductase (NAD-dependent epimerase/dehydratase) [Legionella hackeliae]